MTRPAAPVEILVHVSAPSGGKDDARYRTEAKSYLEFEPAKRHVLLEEDSVGIGDVTKRHSHEQRPVEVREHGVTDAEEKDPSQGPTRGGRDEKERALSSIRTAFENRLPSVHTPFNLGSFLASETTRSAPKQRAPPANLSIPPLKTPSTSKPGNTDLPLTIVKETPYLQVKQTPFLERPRTAPTAATPLQAAPVLRRTQSDSWQTPPSTIPDSQPVPRSSSLPEVNSSPCLKRTFLPSSPSPTRKSPPNPKRPRLQVTSSPPIEGPSAIDSSPPLPPSPSLAPTHISSSPHPSPPKPTSLEIHPPRPKTSHAQFTTHITSGLQEVTKALPLSKGFTPYLIHQTRVLDPLERGHWLVPFHAMNANDLNEIWTFLSDWVKGGEAGFGTRCFREMVDVGGKKGEVLKIYCWGEVVGEIWSLVFIGSKRAVKGLGVQWIDASGEAVLIMR